MIFISSMIHNIDKMTILLLEKIYNVSIYKFHQTYYKTLQNPHDIKQLKYLTLDYYQQKAYNRKRKTMKGVKK